MGCIVFLVMIAIVGGPGTALAGAPEIPPPPTSAADVQEAPLPGDAHGVITRPGDPSRDLLWVPRIILHVPRTILDVVFKPLQLGAMLWDRWQVPDRFRRAFFNDDETFGVYPVAGIDLDLGLSVGIQAVLQDITGRGESLTIQASYGHPLRQHYALGASTGRLLGDLVRLEIDAEIRIAPSERFYGLGNGPLRRQDNDVDSSRHRDPLLAPRVATTRGEAISTRYSRRHVGGALRVPLRVRKGLEVGPAVAASWERPGAPDGSGHLPTGKVFAADTLPGYRGYTQVKGGLFLLFDNREPLGEGRPVSALTSGWRVEGTAWYSHPLEGDVSPFLRYAADARVLIDLLHGMRIIQLRLHIDGVVGDLDKVPFLELPRLGGPNLLRGYDRDRFRDRLAVLGSVEYRWEFHQLAQAFLFLDTGRVFGGPLDFRLQAFRLGFGAGVHIFRESAFGVRAQIASSIDGGIFLNLVFSPGPGVPGLGWD